MEDLMRQIVANLDSPCLFAYSPKELEQVWQINPVPNIHAIMFPELNPNDPDYMDKVSREMEKVMTGKRTLDAATAKRVENEMRMWKRPMRKKRHLKKPPQKQNRKFQPNIPKIPCPWTSYARFLNNLTTSGWQ